MRIQQDLFYTKEHEWVRVEGATAFVGISDHAQEQLGDITYVELPAVGKKLAQFEELGVVESVKAASDVYAPLAGTVASVNESLNDHPEVINTDPYGNGWLCSLAGVNRDELKNLMTADQYKALLEKE
jgi:glycine cleavage system H protein